MIVPDFASAARATRIAACLSACSTTMRGLTGQAAVARRGPGPAGAARSAPPPRSARRALHQAQRLAEYAGEPRDLAAAAARQRQHDRRIGARGARLRRRSDAASRPPRSADGRHSCTAARRACVHVGLERQQRQDVIDVAAHRARAARPPGPDRGRDVVDDRDRAVEAMHEARDPERVGRAVDDHQRMRAVAPAPRARSRACGRRMRGSRRGIAEKPMIEKSSTGSRLVEPGRGHLAAADAGEPQRHGRAFAQRPHQRARRAGRRTPPPRPGKSRLRRGARRRRRRTCGTALLMIWPGRIGLDPDDEQLRAVGRRRDRLGLRHEGRARNHRDAGKARRRCAPRRSAGRWSAGRCDGPGRAWRPSPARRCRPASGCGRPCRKSATRASVRSVPSGPSTAST